MVTITNNRMAMIIHRNTHTLQTNKQINDIWPKTFAWKNGENLFWELFKMLFFNCKIRHLFAHRFVFAWCLYKPNTHTHTKKSKQQVLFHLVGDSFSPSMDSKKKTNLLQKVVFKYVFFFCCFCWLYKVNVYYSFDKPDMMIW